jgi:hypothetical protein
MKRLKYLLGFFIATFIVAKVVEYIILMRVYDCAGIVADESCVNHIEFLHGWSSVTYAIEFISVIGFVITMVLLVKAKQKMQN